MCYNYTVVCCVQYEPQHDEGMNFSAMTDNGVKKSYDVRRQLIYPACAVFCAFVFVFFLGLHWAGANVTESKSERVNIYDSTIDKNQVRFETPDPTALSIQTLLGLLFFAASLVLLKRLFELRYSRVLLRMAHFLLTLLSFFVFVLAMTGYISENGAPAAMLACLGVGVVYFAVLGLSVPIKRLCGSIPTAVRRWLGELCGRTFTVFTVILFALSMFALISGVNVIVTEVLDEVFSESGDTVQTTYVRVVTPLAPTLQNYLRYLITGLIFTLGCAVLGLGINKALAVLFNFLIFTAGYVLVWIVGVDYFKLLPANALTAIVVYLAVYAVAALALGIFYAVKRRKREETEDYESQFMPGAGKVGRTRK